ncbi:hypothetical protein ABT352_15895 [Streptosporangium sp. NPDC000563]
MTIDVSRSTGSAEIRMGQNVPMTISADTLPDPVPGTRRNG